jgi:hypothetical protein
VQDELALEHNDMSVLERFHCAETFKVRDPAPSCRLRCTASVRGRAAPPPRPALRALRFARRMPARFPSTIGLRKALRRPSARFRVAPRSSSRGTTTHCCSTCRRRSARACAARSSR